MLTIYIYSLVSVIIVSLISLLGAFTLYVKDDVLKKYISFFISLAIGALLGDAFIHIIPESFKGSLSSNIVSSLIIGGILLFFIIEKFIHWHHHEDEENNEHIIHPLGKLILFTDGVHNFTDGAIIGASFIVSIPVGIATTIAVILHEIPHEIGDFAVLIHSGYTKGRALLWNFISALTAVLGTVIVLIFGNIGNFADLIIPIAAGGFIYIAVADLIPELHKTKNIKHSMIQLGIIIIGILMMFALLLVG